MNTDSQQQNPWTPCRVHAASLATKHAEGETCPEGAFYAQLPMSASGDVFPVLSDLATAYAVYDNFSGVSGDIAHVRWWGFNYDLEEGAACNPSPDAYNVAPYDAVAAFFAEPSFGEAPLHVQFLDDSEDGGTDEHRIPIRYWHWDFGEPGFDDTRDEQNPTWLFENPGDYQVTLTVTTDLGSDTATGTVTAAHALSGSGTGAVGALLAMILVCFVASVPRSRIAKCTSSRHGKTRHSGRSLWRSGTNSWPGLLLLVAALAALPLRAQAGTWYVDVDNSSHVEDGSSWSTPFTTIQPAIDAAYNDSEGEVWVAEGVYAKQRLSAEDANTGRCFSARAFACMEVWQVRRVSHPNETRGLTCVSLTVQRLEGEVRLTMWCGEPTTLFSTVSPSVVG